HWQRPSAHPADLGGRRGRVFRRGRQEGRRHGSSLRAGRAGRRQLERVLAAAQAGSGDPPAERPRAGGANAAGRARHRAASGEHPADAGPDEDAGVRGQRRLERRRGPDVRAAARAARRAAPPGRLTGRGSASEREQHGVPRERRPVNITFGVKTLLLLLATLLFILAVLSEKDFENLLAWGLASVSLALLLTDLGWARKYGGSMARRSSGP